MRASGDLASVFQDRQIHESWHAVYRRDARQQSFNDRALARIVRCLRLAPESRVLDAGCGTGEHTIRLAQLGLQCVGVDVSQPVLEQAEKAAHLCDLDSRIRFRCESLESLSFAAGSFDAVHCRGVLMHVPRWERVVAELCRVLRPQGKLVFFENNHRALEMRLVRLVRHFRRGESRIVDTPGGVEVWTDRKGEAPLTRVANITALSEELTRHGVQVTNRLAMGFWDVNRFPAGLLRSAAGLFNRFWFACRLPSAFSMGNALIGEKAAR
jgi:ubiquinone/menaquinone biosynthesis C-methylase UbiE